jgi:D-glycero-alpha-D-manno-heptose-7-phosphate kinase
MFAIQVKSPTRVDLAGGTLDCWPLYLFLGDPVTINVAIDVFTYIDLRERHGNEIELHSADLDARKTYPNLAACLADTEPAFELVRAHLRYWKPNRGFYLSTRSDSPVGGGLGGSSSLCISLLKAFSAWMSKPMDPDEMVRIASHLEAQVLLKPTGTQDYFPPIFGGLNFITYGVAGPKVEVRKIESDLFLGRFLLVYTGRSHHSGINNWQVIKNWLDGDDKTRRALKRLAEVSLEMKAALEAGRVKDLARLFEREFYARIDLSDGFSSPEIRRLAAIAASHGAIAKICGAGGGGCVLIWCPERQSNAVAQAIAGEGFAVLAARPWSQNQAEKSPDMPPDAPAEMHAEKRSKVIVGKGSPDSLSDSLPDSLSDSLSEEEAESR